jgi:hypothetical protein
VVVDDAAVRRRLGAVRHPVVADDAGDARPVALEDAGASRGLGGAVRGTVAPGRERLLVAPE